MGGCRKSRYTSDLSDEQWNLVRSVQTAPKTGRPREYSLSRNSQWHFLRHPHRLPMAQRAQGSPALVGPLHLLSQLDSHWLLDHSHDYLRRRLRWSNGRKAKPSAAIIDSQPVKSTECNEVRGFDAGKKINGSKRHLVVDTLGLVLMVMVTTANVQDRDAAQGLLSACFKLTARLTGLGRQWVCRPVGALGWQQFGKCLDIVKPVPGKKVSMFSASVGSWNGPLAGWGAGGV